MDESQNIDTLIIPDFCLVLLVGSAGSGKSTFAKRFFSKTEILSSDRCRALICDDEKNQHVSKDAFELLYHMTALRLKNRRLTVVDATNLQQFERQKFRMIAKDHHAAVIAIIINPGLEICLSQNAGRHERVVDQEILQQHDIALKRTLSQIENEAFSEVFRLSSSSQIDMCQIERKPLKVDQRHITGQFDIIGDIHGCFDELVLLLKKMGYGLEKTESLSLNQNCHEYHITPPEGRRVIFVGDLVDRGPKTPEVLQLVRSMVQAGTGFCVEGNHEAKLKRWLRGKKVNPKYGLAESIAQLSQQSESFRADIEIFLNGLVSHLWLDEGKLLVAHAGLKQEMHGKMSGKEQSFCLYGDTTGEKDEFGWPIRLNWGADYAGEAIVIYGHTPILEPEWQNNSLCIDTGCVFGGKLTALRYPEKELVCVPAAEVYINPKKPLGHIVDEGAETTKL